MLRKIKTYITVLLTAGALLAPVAVPVAVSAEVNQAQINRSLCSGSDINVTTTPSAANCQPGANTEGLNTLLRNIINIFSVIVGVVAVIMIIVGGFRYITSGGESGNVSGAKNTLIYAIVGLVIVALAQLIVHFVLGQAGTVATG